MELTDQLGYEVLALLFDAPSPLSVVFPEARSFLPETRSVQPEELIRWLEDAERRGWVRFEIDTANGSYREPMTGDFDQIAEEYRRGLRDADDIRQILDRFDLWLEISEKGKAAVRSIWPQMLPQA